MPILRHRLAALIGALAVCSTVFLSGGAATAQTYPPGTSVPSCTVGDANAGTVAVGQTIKFVLCGNFAPGSHPTITVNGTTVPVTKTPVNGAVTVTVKVLSTTVLEIEDPVNAPAVCGINKVVATGPSASGGTGISTGFFNLLCTTATTEPRGLAFTGGNVLMALAVAAALIILGVLLVMFQRRRRQNV